MKNPWNDIVLADYEQHMQHEDVGQSKLLNHLTGEYLKKYDPENILFLGVSGGNGLEHVNTAKVKQVCTIDINNSYLEETRKRFGTTIQHLNLVIADVGNSNEIYIKADWVWAALILEYVNIEKCFQFIANNTASFSKLIITIQSNNGVQSVSNTGIESIKSVSGIFKPVNMEELVQQALDSKFEYMFSEENLLPNGKSFITFAFSKIN